MSELKPCPCQNISSGFHAPKMNTMMHEGKTVYYVECRYCGLRTAFFPSKKLATNFWNSRPIEDKLQADINKLSKALDLCLNTHGERTAYWRNYYIKKAGE